MLSKDKIDVTWEMVPYLIKYRIPVYRGSNWTYRSQDTYDNKEMSGIISYIRKVTGRRFVKVLWLTDKGSPFNANTYRPHEQHLSVLKKDIPQDINKFKYKLINI